MSAVIPPYSFTLPMSTPGRQPDPVRGAALTAAVEHCPYFPDATEDDVIRIAKAFERYLAGDDA
jgi:hypothetical protein